MSDPSGGDFEVTRDENAQELPYGHGGVPWLLVLLYIGFLTFFTWYTLEHQLTDYLELQEQKAAVSEAEAEPGGE